MRTNFFSNNAPLVETVTTTRQEHSRRKVISLKSCTVSERDIVFFKKWTLTRVHVFRSERVKRLNYRLMNLLMIKSWQFGLFFIIFQFFLFFFRYTPIQRFMVIKAFRPDRFIQAAQVFISSTLGKKYFYLSTFLFVTVCFVFIVLENS